MTHIATRGLPAEPAGPAPAAGSTRLGRHASIAALVPHYRCEPWLADCLDALVRQTRPLDAIVVIDDGSGDPPADIVRQFPSVTLLAANVNVGPYALMQQVIADTRYDGYLFQDADDWSAPERLSLLLDEAERSGAELVGCQEVLIDCGSSEARLIRYPSDVNRAVADRPASFALAHHTALVSRDLMVRIGGFATGLRVGGDSELLPRATRAAIVRNVSAFGYFRRRRAGSLTTAAETGMESALRTRVAELLGARRSDDRSRDASSQVVSLQPTVIGPGVALRHVVGPALLSCDLPLRSQDIDSAALAGAGTAR